jgi:hypothetical protein
MQLPISIEPSETDHPKNKANHLLNRHPLIVGSEEKDGHLIHAFRKIARSFASMTKKSQTGSTLIAEDERLRVGREE